MGVIPSHSIGRSIESNSVTWFLKRGNGAWPRTRIWSPMRRLYWRRTSLKRNQYRVCTQARTNNLTKNVDTQEMIREIVEESKKESPSTMIELSSLTIRKDVKNNPGIEKKLHKLSLKMKSLAKELSIGWMDKDGARAPASGRGMAGAGRGYWPGHFQNFSIYFANPGQPRPSSSVFMI